MTTELSARCAAARAAFAQHARYYQSKAPFHYQRVVFRATVVGALTFGLEVALLTEVDIRILHRCFTSLLYKFLGRRGYRFERGRTVFKVGTERAMQMIDLRPLFENLWLREQLFWEKNSQLSPFLAALMVLFDWESEPPITADWRMGSLAPALLRLLSLGP